MDVNDGRHFSNTLDDSAEPPGWQESTARALTWALSEVCAAKHAKPSLYTGAGGVAFALLHLVRRQLHPQPQQALEDAFARLQSTERLFDDRRVTLLEGVSGNIALQVCISLQAGQQIDVAALSQRFLSIAKRVRRLDPGECEVLYGRCGFLGAILLLRQWSGIPSLLREEASAIVAEVLNAGRQSAEDGWPLYYEWHEKCYFGGAHGIAGILLTLLQLPDELASADPNAIPLIRSAADKLISQRLRSGNMPSSLGNHKDKCVHWCHGATGFVPLLIKMAEVYREPDYLKQAGEFAEVCWTRGLLSTKGLGLCHGTPGNGYAFLVMWRATGEVRWLRRAQHFAAFSVSHAEELAPLADRPYSLFEGLAGAICFWSDVLHATRSAQRTDILFPCYEFL